MNCRSIPLAYSTLSPSGIYSRVFFSSHFHRIISFSYKGQPCLLARTESVQTSCRLTVRQEYLILVTRISEAALVGFHASPGWGSRKRQSALERNHTRDVPAPEVSNAIGHRDTLHVPLHPGNEDLIDSNCIVTYAVQSERKARSTCVCVWGYWIPIIRKNRLLIFDECYTTLASFANHPGHQASAKC